MHFKSISISLILLFIVIQVFPQRIMENLDRGLVAVRTSSSQVFLSWRILGSDPDLVAFNIYRDGVKINQNPLTGASNMTDQSANASSYTLKTVIAGVETGEINTASLWNNNYLDIPLVVPEGMTMPDGTTCTYTPNDCSTGDVDGDGEYEIILKWDPTNAKDNSQSGYTGNVYIDVYKLNGTQLFRIDLGKNIRAGAHYTQFQVADYDGNGKAEIACKTAPGTKDGTGKFISKGPAATASHTSDYRNTSGYVLSGPEYFTVFNGETGEELATASYNPARGTVSSWGDSYGNRVDRFLAGTAWLDGVLPSIIMCRGYYTRAVIAAWNFRNGVLSNIWTYDSGTTSGVGLYGQGNHNMSVGDVDEDGKDEIIWGAGAVDDDGKLMYRTGLGHGDAMHLSDLDPDRKGLELWAVHESTGAAFGEEMHDARTGEIFWGTFTGSDNGRGVAANIVAGNRGYEMWSGSASGVKSKNGFVLGSSKPSMNFRIYWDGDAEDELLDNTGITKYGVGTIFNASGCFSNNGTKSTPNLSADILGDWREEVIFRTTDNAKLRIFTTTTPTNIRLYTLMHDPVYRASICWQNTAYNQPPHPGFYLGDDMETPPASAVYAGEKRWKNATVWNKSSATGWLNENNQEAGFQDGDGVVFDVSFSNSANLTITENISPKILNINTPNALTLSGSGALTGNMELRKIGSGILKLNNNNHFNGKTTIWGGNFYNNGLLSQSEVFVHSFVMLGGTGTFGQQVNLGILSTLDAGNATGEIAKLNLQSIKETGVVNYIFDVLIQNSQVTAHDTLTIAGDWILGGKSIIQLNLQQGTLPAGRYKIIQISGNVTGDLNLIKVKGVPSYLSYSLQKNNGTIELIVNPPAILTWQGNISNTWDNGKSTNWKLFDESRVFVSNDSVLFNDETTIRSVNISETVSPSSILIETTSNYNFQGTGAIDGTAYLTKKGNGKLTISNNNKYTGKTVIGDGTLEINTLSNGGIASPIGAAPKASANILIDGGRLSYTGSTVTTDRGFSLGKNGGTLSIPNSSTVLNISGQITGPGRFIKEGPGRLSVAIPNNYTGGTSIKAGTIGLTTDVANTSGLGTADTITLMGGSLVMFDSRTTANTSNWNLKVPEGYTGTLNVDGQSTIDGSITGGGMLNYYTAFTGNILKSNVSQFTGVINVTTDTDGGNFVVYNSNGYERSKINLFHNVLMMYRLTADITLPIGDLTGLSKSVLGAGGTGPCTITWEVGAKNTNSTFNGIINNTQYSGTGAKAAINKVGTGAWTLTNANTYTGGTKIMSGELIAKNTGGSATGNGQVQIYADARLSGNGFIDGKVIVDEGAELTPGIGIGTLTVNNQVEISTGAFLTIDIDKPTATSDKLKTSGSVLMNGILQIIPSPETKFMAGDAFKIIEGTITGTPMEIIPDVPDEGLEWDLSDFQSNGTIRVKTITGLSGISLQSAIYPNPASDKIQIMVPERSDVMQLKVFNLTGNLMLSDRFCQNESITLDISAFRNGIYFLSLKTDLNNYTAKFVKK